MQVESSGTSSAEALLGGCPTEVVTHSNADFTGGSFILQQGFAEGETAAVEFTVAASDFPMQINLTEMIFAQSHFNNTTTHWSLLVWEGNPETGNLVASFMSDDVILPHITLPFQGSNGVNVAVSVDPQDPEQIIVNNIGNNTFSVGYRVDMHNNQTGSGCGAGDIPANSNAFPTVDTNGLQHPTRNWIDAINCGAFNCVPNGGWARFSEFSFPEICLPSGDWNIRVTYTPLVCAGVGACCLPNGSCQPDDAAGCALDGGVFQGEGTTCTPNNPCPQPTGACCNSDGSCSEDLTEAQCEAANGIFQGAETVCAGVVCPEPTGACCFDNGQCVEPLTEIQCNNAEGTYRGGNSTCATSSCLGACCFLPSGCLNMNAQNCDAADGFLQELGTTCATTVCFPSGACCFPNGSCGEDVAEEDCINGGGTFQGDGVLCSAVSCPQPSGACCLSNGNCLNLIEDDCNVIPNSSWAGPLTDCTDGNMNGTADDCEAGGVDLVSWSSCANHLSAGILCASMSNCGVEPRDGAGRFSLDMTGATSAATATADCGGGPIVGSVTNGDPLTVIFGALPNGQCTITLGGDATGTFDVVVLRGDVDRNGNVNGADITAVKPLLGAVPGPGTMFVDIDNNGFVNGADVTFIKPRLGTVGAACP